jgi:schlafen family protein
MRSVRDRIGDVEDNFTERKPSGANRADFRRTLVAFANSVPVAKTAILFVGVADKGEILGVPDPDALQKTIHAVAKDDCYPPIEFSSEVIAIEGKHVVAISVPQSKRKPHFAGAAYIRSGSTSVAASAEMYEELVASRHSKAGRILQAKGELVTVSTVGKHLGSTKFIDNRSYRGRHECRVEDCTAHYVRLYEITTGKTLSEPLENITVSRDEERSRLLLIVGNP